MPGIYPAEASSIPPSCDNQTSLQILPKVPRLAEMHPRWGATALEVEAGGLISPLCKTAYDSFLESFSSAIEKEKT